MLFFSKSLIMFFGKQNFLRVPYKNQWAYQNVRKASTLLASNLLCCKNSSTDGTSELHAEIACNQKNLIRR
jgi:hypothetical protein